MNQNIFFTSQNHQISGVLSLPNKYKAGVIFFHGGGRANLKRYEYLQQLFHKKKIASLVFDFMGCGESEGIFEEGSLNQRIRCAHDAINIFLKRSNLTINEIYFWGSSMGGHIACKLLEDFGAKGIILQSAAAYSMEAEDKKFNEEFTKTIQKPNNWKKSPAFNAIKKYKGSILVIYGKYDSLIPKGVIDKYHEIAEKNNGIFKVLKNGIHTLLKPSTPAEKNALVELGKISSNFILD